MKKLVKAFALLAALAVLAACALAEQDGRRSVASAADADEWIAAFLGEHPEELDGAWLMTAQMEAAAAQLGGMKGLAKQLTALGAPQEIGRAREGEVRGLKAYFSPCVFPSLRADLILIVQDGAIAGLTTGAYSGDEEEEPSGAYEKTELALPVPSLNGELPGTLTYPKGEGPFPAVVLVHGSGSSDRDEAVGELKPFRDIAEGLAERGIAVYRFDKRSFVYGLEMAADPTLTLMDESVEDAVNAVKLLSEQEKIDPGRIFVLGHSLGGNAIPAIAGELEKQGIKACGFVMMAASPRQLDELMREQYEFLYSLMPGATPEQLAEKDAVFAELDRLKDLDSLSESDTVLGVYTAYWRWLRDYDALEAAREMDEPCLLLQGEEDYQVTMEDFAMWKEGLAGRENWSFASYPGLTHCFVPGQRSEGSAVYARAGKVDAQVIEDVAAFIEGAGR